MANIDLKGKKEEDLKRELVEHREELRKMRFNVAGTKGAQKNHSQIRKDIARIMTELSSRKTR